MFRNKIKNVCTSICITLSPLLYCTHKKRTPRNLDDAQDWCSYGGNRYRTGSKLVLGSHGRGIQSR
jgi:hypothetical protein